jgi:hypothetical protein
MLRALRLPHVVRLASLRDVRPAENALAAAGYAARAHGDAPAVIVAPLALDEVTPLGQTLETAQITVLGVLPLWDDGVGHAAIVADVA